MPTSYPSGLDNFTNPTGSDYEDVVSHAGQHANANDAIEAIESTLGTTAGTAVIDNFSAGERAVAIAGTATLKNVDAILDEDDMVSDSATALVTQQSVKAYVDAGWYTLGETMTYASADDPTYTATVAGVDLTGVLSAGMRMRVEQSTGGTKYFIVTAVAFSTDTTITLYGGTDYDLENETISNPKFSPVKAPVGFPLDPNKWSVVLSDTTERSQATPTNGTWYNLGSLSIDIPVGLWRVSYQVLAGVDNTTNDRNMYVTLSTANNSESSSNNTSYIISNTSSTADFFVTLHRDLGVWSLSTKDTYYLNAKTTRASSGAIFFGGALSTTYIRAVCSYL